jgi:hypothetical protein
MYAAIALFFGLFSIEFRTDLFRPWENAPFFWFMGFPKNPKDLSGDY